MWPSGFRNSRKEEVVLSRLRIGHTYFTHSYILRQEVPPECTACQEIYSVRHVLIDCIDLGLIRPRFYNVPDMKTLFDTISVDRIISFKSTLLKLYKSLVRSKLYYGWFIDGSATESYLRCLDSIHHLGLRLVLGALRTSPVESLYVEANEAPLSLRQEKVALQYFTKLQSCPSNPAFECTLNSKYKDFFATKESAIPSFGIRIQSALDNSNLLNENVHDTVIPEVPPWILHQPRVNLDLSNLCKKDASSLVFIQKYNEIKDEHSYCTPIYTDGSKDNDRFGCAAIINNISIKQRLPSNASIFTAEIKAIDLALDAIAESEDDHFIIFF